MRRRFEFKIQFLDFLAINLAWFLYYLFRVRSGMGHMGVEPDFWVPMILVWCYWSVIFLFFGLYRSGSLSYSLLHQYHWNEKQQIRYWNNLLTEAL